MNGWKNYETWVVNLWLTNTSGDCDYMSEQAREALDAEAGDKVTATHTLAGWLEGWHDERNPAGELDGPFADLLNHALGCVDWYEIAQYVIDEEYAEWCEDNPQEEAAE
jgi:hypothetical protein